MTVNHGVLGSSPSWGAICGQLVKWLNTPPFHGGIHGFEFHTGHQVDKIACVKQVFLCIYFIFFVIIRIDVEDYMNKKIIIISIFMVLTLAFGAINAKAYEVKSFDDPKVVDGSNVDSSCNGIFTPEALDLIDEILGYFRILAPIVLILMIAVDFGLAVMSSDAKDDAMKKAISRAVRRGIAAILVFLVPTIVKVLLQLDGVKSAIQTDPSCGLSAPRIVENEYNI